MSKEKIMREVLIERIWNEMKDNDNIFFLSDDFGAVALDKIRYDFKDRFINVGIAEQNLINLSIGLACEGFIVYAYAIAAFLTMRPNEQIRNLSMLSQIKKLNINLIGVGAGLSYDLSGPTHQCIEDISILRTFPNIEIFSPSDCVLVEKFVDFSIKVKKPKYIRLDGKPLPQIYNDNVSLENGFSELKKGKKICLISTGYMTHIALKVANELLQKNIDVGVVDVFFLKYFSNGLLSDLLKLYKYIITLEEGFIDKGGLDNLILNLLINIGENIKLKKFGFGDKYIFENGSREKLHKLNNLDKDNIIKTVEEIWKQY